MKKMFIALLIFFFFSLNAGCKNYESIDRVINSSSISRTAVVSVSVRDVNTGQVVYSRDEKLLLHPASTLKAFTVPYVYEKLGKDYKLDTSFYVLGSTLYIDLSGDPLLSGKNLDIALKNLKARNINKISSVVINDKIMDEINWGVGWMWDDDKNPYMPKYSAYNIDHNLSYNGVPVTDPKANFINILKCKFKTSGITFNGGIRSDFIPADALLQYKLTHNLPDVLKIINKKSDNLAAETVLKLASRDKYNLTGSTKRGVKELIYFYEQMGLKNSDIIIVDASGVSHNDLVQTDWMSLVLTKIYKKPYAGFYISTLPSPGNGTLSHRLLEYPFNIWAKTGTLSAISGITGYIKTQSGSTYSFAILIQNCPDTNEAKKLEDKIIEEIIRS